MKIVLLVVDLIGIHMIEYDLFVFLIDYSIQATSVNIAVASHVWVEDPKLAWIDGEVFRISGNEVHVRTTTGKTVCIPTLGFPFFFFSI